MDTSRDTASAGVARLTFIHANVIDIFTPSIVARDRNRHSSALCDSAFRQRACKRTIAMQLHAKDPD
jgi:hypothetical protein